jgi:hypothetical protein
MKFLFQLAESHRGIDAMFSHPSGIAVDGNGDVFIFDVGNECIRKISAKDGTVSTHCELPYREVDISSYGYWGIACGFGDVFWGCGNCIFRVSKDDKTCRILTGTGREGSKDGSLSQASFSNTISFAIEEHSRNIFITDTYNNSVRMISLRDERVTTIAGTRGVNGSLDGIGQAATLYFPYDIALHNATGDLFVVDNTTDYIRKISRIKGDAGKVEWMVTSILISARAEYISVALFSDTLFLTCWRSGSIIKTSLSGATQKVLGRVKTNSFNGLAADAIYLYSTDPLCDTTMRIAWRNFWSPQEHQNFDEKQRQIIQITLMAYYVANTPTSKPSACLLAKLPREILFFILSFLEEDTL